MTDLLSQSVFYEFATLFAFAAICGMVGVLLRQPLIVSFIIVGIVSGPSALHIIHSDSHIELLSQLGIAVLLFLVGLKLDLKLIKTLGVVSLTTGLGQVFFTAVVGYFLCIALGIDSITAAYVSVALTFSSTIIVVKLLSDKKEVDSLHGRIALGFLIVQDVVVVIAMIALSAMGVQEETNEALILKVLEVILHGSLVIIFIGFFMKFLANRITEKMASLPELLLAFAMAWAVCLAAVCDYLGLSKEMGGLLAGISLASTPFREAMISRMSSLRDFLLLFFFIALGSQLDFATLGDQVLPALVLSAFVLIGNPLIVMIIMGIMGYRKRTGFLAGLTVAQISEFSLIFMAMGMETGNVSNESLGLVTLVGLITIFVSVYMIGWSHVLYAWLDPYLSIFERKDNHKEEAEDSGETKNNYDVILFGLGRYGRSLGRNLIDEGKKVLAVDFNTEVVKKWKNKGRDVIYGDACDPDFLDKLPLKTAKWVVLAMPRNDNVGLAHGDARLVLLNGLREQKFQGNIAVATNEYDEIDMLKEKGATLVFVPFKDAADQGVIMMSKYGGIGKGIIDKFMKNNEQEIIEDIIEE